MAEAEKTLTSTYESFRSARGVDFDGTWAFAVSWRLMMHHVEVDQVREGLEEAVEVVRESQESPVDLFGQPHEYATDLYRRWKSEGRLQLTRVGVPSARSLPASSLRAGSWIALLMFVWSLLDHEDLTVGVFAIPVGLGVASIGSLALWDRASRRWETPAAVAAVMGAMAVFGAVMIVVLHLTSQFPVGSVGPWILLVEAALLWILGTGLLIVVTAKTYARARDGLDDELWVERFSGILRGPGWVAGPRVRDIVLEARSHAAESGRTLAEEFGTPEHHAAQFGVDSARRSKLKTALLTVLTGLGLMMLLDGWTWSSGALVVLLAWLAWKEYRRYRGLRNEQRRQL